MKALIFKLLNWIGRETVLEWVNDKLTRPDGGNQLELAFVDDKGRAYYRYPDGLMPVVRMGEIQTYTSYLAVSLTSELINQAFDDCEVYLAKGETMKVGAVLTSLKDFQRRCVNIDAMLNILAASYVREDENANGFDTRVHDEKLRFLDSKIDDTAFFFNQRESRELFKKYNLSTKDALELQKRYQAMKSQHLNRLEAISGTKYIRTSSETPTPSGSS